MIHCLIMNKHLERRVFGEQKKFMSYLNRTGAKVSVGRMVVFRETMASHGHFTAEDLVKACNRNKQKVSRATVYRSIRELLEAGVIRKTAFGEKHEHYEHVYDEKLHHHARCIRCFDVIEFPDLKEDTVYVPFLEKKRFQILGHEMHFYGICWKCQNDKVTSKKR